MQKRKGLCLGQDCSPLGSGWNHVRDIKENNWVGRTPGWVILYCGEEYTGWSHLQSMRLWRQEYCAPHFPLSPFPDHPSTFSTVRYNIYDPAFSQKTRDLQSYQRKKKQRKHYALYLNCNSNELSSVKDGSINNSMLPPSSLLPIADFCCLHCYSVFIILTFWSVFRLFKSLTVVKNKEKGIFCIKGD